MTTTDPPFDPDALRQRYRVERDKRIREDGNEQYLEMAGDFAHYLDDPYVQPLGRGPLADEVAVAVIGGGFGGLLAGARLREAGVEDLRIIEKGGDFGGTWYWNRYPGAACDIESYIYLPLLEEIGFMPKEKYTRAPEILDHSRKVAEHYDLYRGACFQTEVTAVEWHDADGRWISAPTAATPCARHLRREPHGSGRPARRHHRHRCHRGAVRAPPGGGGRAAVRVPAHAVVDRRAQRPAHRPRLGGVARARLAEAAHGELQQPRHRHPRARGPGGRRLDRHHRQAAHPRRPAAVGPSADDVTTSLELADFDKMEQIRARVDEIVADPTTAEALKPYYRQLCKRPCFHDEYLDAFNRPNVSLVDTDGRGVEEITERGVVANGVEYELDCIIYATGFEVGTEYTRRAGYEVVGRDGITLTEKWADGAQTFHGMHSRGFPNCFIVSLIQSGFTANFPHMLDEQSKHLAYILNHADTHGMTRIEAGQEAEDAWVQTIVGLAQLNEKFLEACTPGFYNNEGRPAERSLRNTSYGAGSVAFIKVLEAWRAEATLPGLELT